MTAGTTDPSSTQLLADRITERIIALAQDQGHSVAVSMVSLRELASDITTALTGCC